MQFILNLKTKGGNLTIKSDRAIITIKDLKQEIYLATKISAANLKVLSGFPPKKLNLDDDSALLEDCNVRSGDALIIEEQVTEPVPAQAQDEVELATDKLERLHLPKVDEKVEFTQKTMLKDGNLIKKVVPSDNSCLFTAIGFLLRGRIDLSCAQDMRRIVVDEISRRKKDYNTAMLGRPNEDYCRWINCSDSWGGAIEISVLSQYFGVEFVVVDSVNGILNRFGEDQSCNLRGFLIFDGIHYDVLYVDKPLEEEIQALIPVANEDLLIEAQMIAIEAKRNHQFTDLGKFNLICVDCGAQVVGRAEAELHAEQTKHENFNQIVN